MTLKIKTKKIEKKRNIALNIIISLINHIDLEMLELSDSILESLNTGITGLDGIMKDF